MAAPIVTIAWMGAGAGNASAAAATGTAVAGAAAATGGAAATGSAVAGGTGLAIVGGKTAATVLAVVAIGGGSVVVGEKVVSERSGSDASAETVSSKSASTPTVPAQSLTVGEKAAAAGQGEQDCGQQAPRACAGATREGSRQACRCGQALCCREGQGQVQQRRRSLERLDQVGRTRQLVAADPRTATPDRPSRQPATAPAATAPAARAARVSPPRQGGGNGSANSNAGGKSKE